MEIGQDLLSFRLTHACVCIRKKFVPLLHLIFRLCFHNLLRQCLSFDKSNNVIRHLLEQLHKQIQSVSQPEEHVLGMMELKNLCRNGN